MSNGISCVQVLESAAGFYLGRTQNGCPYDRQSHYYYSKWEPSILLGVVDQLSAIQEIKVEIPRAKALKSKLAKDRLKFLEASLVSFTSGIIPTERWDYSRMS